MGLIYAFVAREQSIVLAEYTSFSGNFNTVALECLQNVKAADDKFTITCSSHTFNFARSNGFTLLVVAEEAFGRQIPFAFLERVADEFNGKWAAGARNAAAHSLDRTFGPKLKTHMDYCMAHPDEVCKVAAVQKKVDDVKGIMVQNIERVLQRGERIELLVDKTDDLKHHAEQFQKQGRDLRTKMWYNSVKVKLVMVGIVLLLAVVIFLIACFSSGRNCTQKN